MCSVAFHTICAHHWSPASCLAVGNVEAPLELATADGTTAGEPADLSGPGERDRFLLRLLGFVPDPPSPSPSPSLSLDSLGSLGCHMLAVNAA
jgi:hypothetical protein